jgi:hypothetical protein
VAFPTATIATGGRQPLLRGAGPYLIGGVLYTVIWNETLVAEMWQSLDGGNTWAQVDAGGAPSINALPVTAACTDGVNIFVASLDPTGTFVGVWTFSTTTGLWDTGHLAGGTTNLGQANVGCAYVPPPHVGINGKVVILENDIILSGIAGKTRCSFSVYDTVLHTFTASVACGQTSPADPQNWNVINIVRGISQCHFIFTSSDPGTFANAVVYQQPLPDGSSPGGIQIVDNTVGNTNNADDSYYAAVSDGSTVVIGFVPNTTLGVSARVYQGTSGGVIAFTPSTIPIPAVTVTGLGLARTLAGITAFYFAVDDTVNTSFYFAINSGAGFGPVTFLGLTSDAVFTPNSIPMPVGAFISPANTFAALFRSGVGGGLSAYLGIAAGAAPAAGPTLTLTFKGMKVYG